jgi:hypothetical protein
MGVGWGGVGGANNGALRESLGRIFFGASWAVIFFGKKSPKESTFFLREYFVANFLF